MKIQIGDEIRDMTPAELENYNAILASIEVDKQQQAQKQQNRANAISKLEALGLTAEEIAALVGA
jgi:hypothetical protein